VGYKTTDFQFIDGDASMVCPDDSQQVNPDLNSERELRLANDEWARALAARDELALGRIMADDFVLAYPFEGDDKGQFIANVVAGELTVESLEARDATVRVSGPTGLVFGSETANWSYRGRNLSGKYRFLRVYTRQQDRWQIVALHLCAPASH
jgi:ketosteroid isomerase-like protein